MQEIEIQSITVHGGISYVDLKSLMAEETFTSSWAGIIYWRSIFYVFLFFTPLVNNTLLNF